MSVFEAEENLAFENLTMKTRNALCHSQGWHYSMAKLVSQVAQVAILLHRRK